MDRVNNLIIVLNQKYKMYYMYLPNNIFCETQYLFLTYELLKKWLDTVDE